MVSSHETRGKGTSQLHDPKPSTKKKSIRSKTEKGASQSARDFGRIKALDDDDDDLPNTRKRRGTLSSSLETSFNFLTSTVRNMKEKDRDLTGAGILIKPRSEASLMLTISKKLIEKSGILHKSSSLIEMKPTSSSPPKTGSFLQLGKSPKQQRGYFGLSLDDTMAIQKDKYPDATIPFILVKLTEEIIKNDGCKTEGIFRITGSTQQVTKLQQHYNDMNFDETSSDPHVLVGVLKQWLRDLPEPLIPIEMYYDCLKCETTEECLQVVDKLPPLNKGCFGHLVKFVRTIAQPENHEFTKMNVQNLCVVFAPVMFRCPSTDMADLMVNLQKEKLFLAVVIESSAFS